MVISFSKEQADFITANGESFQVGQYWYRFPMWYRHIEGTLFDVVPFDEIPPGVRRSISELQKQKDSTEEVKQYFHAVGFFQKNEDVEGGKCAGYTIMFSPSCQHLIDNFEICEVFDYKNKGKDVHAIAMEIVDCLNRHADIEKFKDIETRYLT